MELLTLRSLSSDATVRALGWTLVHFLWQGALVAVVLELVLASLRRAGSETRYALRCAALVSMGLAPAITFVALRASALETAPFEAALAGLATSLAPGVDGLSWQSLVVLGWSLGVLVFGLRLLRDYLRIRTLYSAARGDALPTLWQARFDGLCAALGVRALARVVDSGRLAAPAVIGCLRPIVLLPARVLTGLSTEQIEALIAHELAHVRRHDFLVNLVQSALEAALFYHPAVWWVSRGIRIEREYCCDDVAVRVIADRLAYARALTTLEGWRGMQHQALVSTLGGSLMHRIQRIVGVQAPLAPRRSAVSALGALLVVGALGASAFGHSSTLPGEPSQDPEKVREMRQRLSEMQTRVDEMRALVEELERERDDLESARERRPRRERTRDADRSLARELAEAKRAHARALRKRGGRDGRDLHEAIRGRLEELGVRGLDLDAAVELHGLEGNVELGEAVLDVLETPRAKVLIERLHDGLDGDEAERLNEHLRRARELARDHADKVEFRLHGELEGDEHSGEHGVTVELEGRLALDALEDFEFLEEIEELDDLGISEELSTLERHIERERAAERQRDDREVEELHRRDREAAHEHARRAHEHVRTLREHLERALPRGLGDEHGGLGLEHLGGATLELPQLPEVPELEVLRGRLRTDVDLNAVHEHLRESMERLHEVGPMLNEKLGADRSRQVELHLKKALEAVRERAPKGKARTRIEIQIDGLEDLEGLHERILEQLERAGLGDDDVELHIETLPSAHPPKLPPPPAGPKGHILGTV